MEYIYPYTEDGDVDLARVLSEMGLQREEIVENARKSGNVYKYDQNGVVQAVSSKAMFELDDGREVEIEVVMG